MDYSKKQTQTSMVSAHTYQHHPVLRKNHKNQTGVRLFHTPERQTMLTMHWRRAFTWMKEYEPYSCIPQNRSYRFEKNRSAWMTNITQAFLQVRIHKEHAQLVRYLDRWAWERRTQFDRVSVEESTVQGLLQPVDTQSRIYWTPGRISENIPGDGNTTAAAVIRGQLARRRFHSRGSRKKDRENQIYFQSHIKIELFKWMSNSTDLKIRLLELWLQKYNY